MKAVKTWGIIVSVLLIAFAVLFPVPEKRVHVSSSYAAYDNTWADNEGAAYIGGDAYNYEIEASLKAGYVGGVLALKGITFVGGILLFFQTLLASSKHATSETQLHLLYDLKKSAADQTKILNQISEQLSEAAKRQDDGDGSEKLVE